MNSPSKPQHGPGSIDLPDVHEYGAEKNGVRQSSDRRLFIQLLVFTECFSLEAASKTLQNSGLESVLYADVNDPRGIGVLVLSEDPSLFTGKARSVFLSEPFRSLKAKTGWTMMGRTYSSGFEQDLEDWLLRKPRRNLFNASFNWALWYPLRRKPEFEQLTKEEQRPILMEHAKLGMGYGQAELAHDVRLACHGLDAHDNEFLLGLVSKELYPLSRLVQDMRKTQQTSRYIQQMGPFFVGHVMGRFGHETGKA